jgi:hypothetical protein
MDECDNAKGDDMTIKVLAGVISLGTILVLGGYGYTWSESKTQEQEKYQWRQDHQRVLDKRFDELRQGQEKLADKLDRNTSSVEGMLQKILDEQKRVSDSARSSSKSR